MLYVFTGSDTVAVRAAAYEWMESLDEQANVLRVAAEDCTPELLSDRIAAQSLFSTSPEVTLIDSPQERVDAFSEVVRRVSNLGETKNIFILIDGAFKKADADVLKKHAAKYHELKGVAPKRFNVFGLADAFARRDKKSLWILLMRAQHAGLSPEEIAGTLFWQVKTLRLAERTADAEEANIKPFVYNKAKRAVQKFKRGELDRYSQSLVSLYHEAHLGKVDMARALERWVLRI